MFDLSTPIKSFLLVSSGAVLGSYLRMAISNFFNFIFSRKYIGTILVNLLACFLIGILFSLQFHNMSMNLSRSFKLFFVIGFLGSFSTFSTFIMNVSESLIEKKYKDSFYLVFVSLLGGLLAAASGIFMANAYN